MKRHDVQSIELEVPLAEAFRVIAEPTRLPEWTHAFREVEDGEALMRTPQGEARVGLEVETSEERGTIDWVMRFPDGTEERAYARLLPAGKNRTVFTFVLLPPGASLENLEGRLSEQSAILAEELRRLKRLLEHD